MAYVKGDVVLVPFLFTDLSASRVRPAVVVNSEEYGAYSSDVIVAMVTSQPQTGPTDWRLQDWQEAGLVYQSWVRAKLATLERTLIQFSPGRLSHRDVEAVERRLEMALGIGNRR
jgi:mRNA interferase MazF